MKYGVDVASTRLDDLDKRLLVAVREKVQNGVAVRVLDIGCGQGGLTTALALAGASVVALDIDDYSRKIAERLRATPELDRKIQFVKSDITDCDFDKLGHFDIVVMQRVLHYLPYQTAKTILSKLAGYSTELYLSVTGVDTEIGRYYSQSALLIGERFDRLSQAGQELFLITEPVCLYTESEIISLLEEVGWGVSWSRVSDFGNIKVVAIQN